jgi:hypothetical protein
MFAMPKGPFGPAELALIERARPLVAAEGLQFNAAGMTRAIEIVKGVSTKRTPPPDPELRSDWGKR